MPWGSQGGGPWGSGKGPWGSGPQSSGPTPPDLEELLRRCQDKLRAVLPGGSFSGRGFALIALAVLALWGFSGFFRVEPDELGVVLRFGKYVRDVQPGLNYHLPYPMESALTPKALRVNKIDVAPAGTASRIRSWKGRIPLPPGFRSRLRRAGAAFSIRCASKASRRGSKASRPLPPRRPRRRRPGRRCRNRNSGDIQRAGVPALRLSSKWDSANRG